MARLHVVRHGETEWNLAGRYQGRLESRLTRLGLQQAQALAQAFSSSGVARVFSSPLQRCTQTADAIAAALGLDVTIDERLVEIAHGTWEGRLRDEIERDDSQGMNAWRTAPQTVAFEGGESLADVEARWEEFVDSLSEHGDAVVVTHDVVVRLAILSATKRPHKNLWTARVCNGGYAVLQLEGSGEARHVRLLDECRDAHLGTLFVDPNAQAL
jgi:phosphoserine phosphatase